MENFARDVVVGGGKGRPPKCRRGHTECFGFRACKSCKADYMRAHRKANGMPESQKLKDRARSYANVYFRRGKLAAEPCKCGSYDVEKHHPDYSKPLQVIWLCRDCHLALHQAEKSGSP